MVTLYFICDCSTSQVVRGGGGIAVPVQCLTSRALPNTWACWCQINLINPKESIWLFHQFCLRSQIAQRPTPPCVVRPLGRAEILKESLTSSGFPGSSNLRGFCPSVGFVLMSYDSWSEAVVQCFELDIREPHTLNQNHIQCISQRSHEKY